MKEILLTMLPWVPHKGAPSYDVSVGLRQDLPNGGEGALRGKTALCAAWKVHYTVHRTQA